MKHISFCAVRSSEVTVSRANVGVKRDLKI